MAKLDISKIAERLSQLNNGGRNNTSADYLKLKDGRNVVRILPAKNEDDMFFEEAFLHYGVNKTEENKRGTTVVCPTTYGEDKACPICELSKHFRSLSKAKDDAYDKKAREIGRKKRVYFNAIDRSDNLTTYEEQEDGKWSRKNAEDKTETPVKILATGISILKDILSLIVDPEYGDITDATEGLDIIITKTGTGFNTNYDVKTVRKESAIGFDAWNACLNDLSKVSVPKSYNEIANLLSGDDNEEEEVEDTKEETSTGEAENKEQATSGSATEDELQDEIEKALARRRNK